MARLTLRNHFLEVRIFSTRMVVLGFFLLGFALLLIFRLAYLELFEHERYTTLSQQNRLTLIPIEPNRGLIYDRNGVLLAKNDPVFNLVVYPNKVKDFQSAIEMLQKIIEITPSDLDQYHKQRALHRPFEAVPLRFKLTDEELAKFYVNRYRLEGFDIEAGMLRSYPMGSLFAHLLGYVARMNTDDIAQHNDSNYAATNYLGKIGLEKFYEDRLHGSIGYQQVEINAAGHILRVLNKIPAIHGDNLYLSVDSHLQQTAKDALGDTKGAIVAIEPATGQVLAMVSEPSYDPNLFVTGLNRATFAKLQTDERQPLYNRAIRGQYPPASTIKPFLALKGLQSGVVDINEEMFDPGWYKLKKSEHLYRDWHPGGHGWVDLHRAIVVSCDTYFYDMANQLGILRIQEFLHQFGFGQSTGVDLGEELPGLVPSPEWKRQTLGLSWYPGDTLITGIGQGYMLATPLQLAHAVATLAKHGERFQPSLLLKSQTADGKITLQQPIPLPPIRLPESEWKYVINAMKDVLEDKEGTAHRLGSFDYEIAAKTGTAQVYNSQQRLYVNNDLPEKLRDHSLFIAFAPLEHPEIALAIIVEHDPSAAPSIARDILIHYFSERNSNHASIPTRSIEHAPS